MLAQVLVTGSEGLVGRALTRMLRAQGYAVRGLDRRACADERGDVRDADRLRPAIDACDGVVHLAAVSRVVWGERDPDLCWGTNVVALAQLLRIALESPRPPWVIFASSREVYGEPRVLPASEDTPLAPINTYGRSKVEGERLCLEAAGLRVAIVRLSNVYDSALDHRDRVVPAFIRAAVAGTPLRVEGSDNSFDFTHVDDVALGLMALVDNFARGGAAMAPLHFVSGVPTTLGELAHLVLGLAGSGAPIVEARSRNFDVARFYGDPSRAHTELGWRATVPLEVGIARLIADVRDEQRRGPTVEVGL